MNHFESHFSTWVSELSPRAQELVLKIPFGKRLRARLIAMIAGESLEARDLACVVELIHAASLLHDDVIDDALTRRGVPSINALYGNKTAIMLGDILYSHAFSKLPALGKEVASDIAVAVLKLSEGELADVELAATFNTNQALYEEMIENKTAALIEASAACAGRLIGADHEALGRYGKLVGIAFQVIDDLLDITSDEKTLGKPVMNDLFEGKTTLPYMFLYKKLSDDEKNMLCALFKKELKDDEKIWLMSQMRHHGVLEETVAFVKNLCDEALSIVQTLDLPSRTKEELTMMVAMMTQRVY